MCSILQGTKRVSHQSSSSHRSFSDRPPYDESIILDPKNVSFECFADADFCGSWDKNMAEEDGNTSKSLMGYVLTYSNCPLVWASKLARPICLSTMEAKYVAVSAALMQVIPVM